MRDEVGGLKVEQAASAAAAGAAAIGAVAGAEHLAKEEAEGGG